MWTCPGSVDNLGLGILVSWSAGIFRLTSKWPAGIQ